MTDAKTILLTGVSRGLGRAMTQQFAQRGHTVIGCCRSPEAVDELRKSHAPPHSFAVVDVAVSEQVSEWADEVLSRHEPPDLLINNAACINDPAPLWQVDVDAFSRLIDINVKGVFHVLRYFLPAMVRRGRGVVVNFSSTWGRSTSADVAPYCCSKWGIEGLTRALADELPSGLAAATLNPGVIDTDMLRICFGDHASSYPGPDEWAERAVPMLLGLDETSNGQSLTAPAS